MPIPASGFCLSTVCSEFVTPRYGDAKMTCFLHWASQNSILVGDMGGCTLSQFGGKCRVSLGTATAIGGAFSSVGCFKVDTTINHTGRDMRPSTPTSAIISVSYVVCKQDDINPIEIDTNVMGIATSCKTAICVTSTSGTVCSYVTLNDPYPSSGNSISYIYACGTGLNGFGEEVTGSPVTATITWLASEDGGGGGFDPF
jgi:hypothetical protein